jgi:outer membrane protein assembly factor BamB
MIRRVLMLACVLLASFSADSANAAETMSDNIARRLGLEQAWQRQIQVPAGASSIVDQQLHVENTEPREYVEIVSTMTPPASDKNSTKTDSTEKKETYTKVLLRIATDQVGRNGKPIGKAEAERQANNELRRLTHRGVKAKLSSRTVPRIRLYTMSDDGTLDCRDAESGLPIWMVRVGDRQLGYAKIGIDDEFITVINGGNLIKLDATDGTELSSVRTTTQPLYGAIHAGDYSLVPTIRNGIEGYPLKDPSRDTFSELVDGLTLAPPRKSPTSSKIAWGTNSGFVYVMESEGSPSILFRLNTDGIVSGRIAAASGDLFFFGSETGQVYGLHATRVGDVLWSRPYGEPFYDAPFVVDDQVLIRSTYGNLYSLRTSDGMMTWTYTVPNVDQLLGACDGKAYARSLSGGLLVIDLDSGKTILKTNEIQPSQLIPNSLTDRIYLVGKTGAVQCLRTAGSFVPKLNAGANSAKPRSTETESMEEEPAGPSSAFASQDKAEDPFGGAAPDGGSDPFGGAGADPFGGGGDAMADPFGGGDGDDKDPFADPFGN